MKKLFTLIALCAVCFTTKAQTTTGVDTMTNAQTLNITVPTNYFAGGDGVWTASLVATKITGTTAGTARLQASVDGTNYQDVLATGQTYADTFNLSNTAGAQVKNWYRQGMKIKSLRIQIATTGTQSTKVQGYFIKK